MAQNDKSGEGCLGWFVFIIGGIPGIIIAMILPKSFQLVGMVIGGIAFVLCVIKGLKYKKPRFWEEPEPFGHAFKRFMWGILATMALGLAFVLGLGAFGCLDLEEETPKNATEQVPVEQTEPVQQ